jgi:hypothetical protein
MLLIAAFAVYVILTKRLRITRSTSVTGPNARNFGIALLILLIPFRVAIGFLVDSLLPDPLRTWPVPEILFATLFAVAVLGMASYFRDATSNVAKPRVGPEAAKAAVERCDDLPQR